MNKMLVAIFDREAAAYEGLSALKDLHRDGDISLYSSAVVAKDSTGKIELKQAADEGPVGTAVGLLTGSLMVFWGACRHGPRRLAWRFGWPDLRCQQERRRRNIPRRRLQFAHGRQGRSCGGDRRELDCSGRHMPAKLGGVLFRRLRGEVVEDQIARESAAFEADLKALNDELKQAAAENRAAIQKDIERVKMQIKATHDRAGARLDQAKAETEARVKALQDQAKAAAGMAKARIERRIAAAKADFETRSKKMGQAWTLTKEALAA